MRLATSTGAALALALIVGAASARDDRLHFPISEATTSANAQAKLNPDVRLYWGGQKHPKPKQQFGTFTSNKKTNFFNKSDKEACDWAFLSAVIALQERARKEGGNAVVNIKSVYKDVDFISQTEYECGAGNVTGGVALRGDVVRLP